MKNYDDIINLPHHTSKKYERMERSMRAAQFAPFSALAGYEEAVRETARYLDEEVELTESMVEILRDKIQYLQEIQSEHPYVSIKYFEKDEKKQGGKYITIEGRINKFNEYKNEIIIGEEKEIPIEKIIGIEYQNI